MRRTYIIAANTLRESLRQKLIILLALVALVLVGSSNYFLKLDLGHERLKFVFDFTSGALGFFGSIIAVVATCQLFQSEFENKTAITLLSKPISFAEFTWGKACGTFAVLGLFCTVVAACGCAMLELAQSSLPQSAQAAANAAPNYAGIVVFTAIQWSKLCSIAAITALVCAASTSLLFSVVVSLGVVAICSTGEIGASLGAPKTFISETSSIIFPNLQIFNTSEAFAFAPVKISAAIGAGAYALVYTSVCLFASAWIFSKREF